MPDSDGYDENVFVNCPFDGDYAPLFDAIVFAIHDCGFVARCALEAQNSAQIRFEKIVEIIEACRLGVHDISRTELDDENSLPRFNMPMEMGLFLGAHRFGGGRHEEKGCLVLDRAPYRYQKFCSDMAGQDIRSHGGDPAKAIEEVCDWLRNATAGSGTMIPGGKRIAERYDVFLDDLPALCRDVQLDPDDLIYSDYTTLVVGWLDANPW